MRKDRSESFAMAKDAYAEAILENTHLLGDGNYQFNLHNILSYHYLGVLEYWDYQPKKDFRPVLVEKASTKRILMGRLLLTFATTPMIFRF